MNIKICIHCEFDFDLDDPRKVRAGGRINECPDCIEDMGGDKSPPKYLGVSAGDGKMAGLTILKFASNNDRDAYSKMWRNNSGQNKGKSCQLGAHLTTTSGIKFETVQKTEAVNHKGKL
jgi:hypothetical protein